MFVNIVLCIFKLVAGIVGRSGAMVADAVHSISDFATDCVVLFFVRISSKPKDKDHAYGHGKYETVASVIIALALAAVGIGICVSGAKNIAAVIRGEQITRPEFIALVAAVVSIVAKEWLYRYTVKVGKQTDSAAVVANAWHHRSDALSSIGTLIGIGCAYTLGGKWAVADPIAAIVVAAMILKVAYDLVRQGFDELVDGALPEEVETEIEKKYGLVTINKREIDVTAPSAQMVYNGEALVSNNYLDLIIDESKPLANGDYIASAVIYGEQIKIGDSDNRLLSVTIKNAKNQNVSENYIINLHDGRLVVTAP